ncbi:anhydro-N-acetylmuramic acid kinase [Thiofilum flexile]|uniref:anhydro-N-acetylmuramic acid kinase n=1 Tax=Thiofilum flexile TaxID=125627 RepID=UPI0003796305|nr:anhydro-N-acetylmuramic acid kinase [Thiofilum flexile]
MGETTPYYIGLMSGTSLDGIDTVLVSFEEGSVQLHYALCYPLTNDLRQQINQILSPEWRGSLMEYGHIDQLLGLQFAQAVNELLAQAQIRPEQISAIGSHGQTICHAPTADMPFTLQAGDPNQISEHTGITTVADFRRRDMAAGGQGAPLVPAFHRAIFFNPETHRTVLNIGGLANLTVLNMDSTAPVYGFDTGPGNTLIDQWAFKYTGQHYDKDGEWARGGTIHTDVLEAMLKDTYFKLIPPKSTGREHFNLGWVAKKIGHREVAAQDVQATLTELTAITISQALQEQAPQTQELVLCGGGVHNRYLWERIQHHCPNVKLLSTADLGADPDWVEAIAFAWFAKQTLEGKPSNMPSVTGARGERVLGGVYSA